MEGYKGPYLWLRGRRIEPINHSYLHDESIKERLDYFDKMKSSQKTNQKSKNNKCKYFKEKSGVSFASGICKKLYRETKFGE